MGEFTSYLSEFDEAYEQAEEVGFTELPDGKYQARIERAAIEPNKKTGELMLVWELVIVTGDYEGKTVRKLNTIRNETLSFIKTDFSRLNVQIEKFSKLESYLPEVLDLIVNIELKHGKANAEGKSYQNIYLNKVVGRVDKKTSAKSTKTSKKNESKEHTAPPIMDDDLPF